MSEIEFRVGLKNGKYGYGADSWEALKNAIGAKKAHIIAGQIGYISSAHEIVGKNGVTIGFIEKRLKP